MAQQEGCDNLALWTLRYYSLEGNGDLRAQPREQEPENPALPLPFLFVFTFLLKPTV